MNLAFAATSLEHMRRRSEFPKESRPLPLAVKSAAGDAEAKASITNAALSTDVRGGFAGTEDALRASLRPRHTGVGTVSSRAS